MSATETAREAFLLVWTPRLKQQVKTRAEKNERSMSAQIRYELANPRKRVAGTN